MDRIPCEKTVALLCQDKNGNEYKKIKNGDTFCNKGTQELGKHGMMLKCIGEQSNKKTAAKQTQNCRQMEKKIKTVARNFRVVLYLLLFDYSLKLPGL